MKKILILTILAALSMTSLYANPNYAMQHANPMPNLVRYTLGNAELLGLDAQQIGKIKAWAKQNKPTMRKLVQDVMHQERMLMEEALGADLNTAKIAEETLKTRQDIMTLKTLCRAHLKGVLTQSQYKNVLGIYRSTLPKMQMQMQKQ
ncbi:MAG: hypothetical protein H8E76_08835 [Helicobacteraceae bacterium]|nr:hypothetical protein [Candidatus Sulfurimonas ponti]MBL6972781.1 hypothetical protein [Sulfurimonas sp.]